MSIFRCSGVNTRIILQSSTITRHCSLPFGLFDSFMFPPVRRGLPLTPAPSPDSYDRRHPLIRLLPTTGNVVDQTSLTSSQSSASKSD